MSSDDIFLDSGATLHSVTHKSYLDHVVPLKTPKLVNGIAGTSLYASEGGGLNCLRVDGFPEMSKGILLTGSSFNLISLGQLTNYGITFIGLPNETMELWFTHNGQTYFNLSHKLPRINIYRASLTDGLLFTCVDKKFLLNKINHSSYLLSNVLGPTVPTRVEKNFSKNEIDRASEARDFHMERMHPGGTAMKRSAAIGLAGNLVQNDFTLMESVY